MNRKMLTWLVLLLALAFAWLVWPTPYRYEHLRGGFLVRFNRFTGHAERFNRGSGNWEGWPR